jgi:hypothetical protein
MVFLEVPQDLNIEKVDWQPSRSKLIMHQFGPLLDTLTPTLDASETGAFIPELC